MIYASILVVDDDPLVRMNTIDTLVDAGYACSGAESLATGWSLLSHRRFDLVVCDHDLGDGKGSSLVRRLAETGDTTPFVYMSGAGDVVERELAGAVCVRRILQKPVDAATLLAVVAASLAASAPVERRFPRLIGDEEREKLLDCF